MIQLTWLGIGAKVLYCMYSWGGQTLTEAPIITTINWHGSCSDPTCTWASCGGQAFGQLPSTAPPSVPCEPVPACPRPSLGLGLPKQDLVCVRGWLRHRLVVRGSLLPPLTGAYPSLLIHNSCTAPWIFPPHYPRFLYTSNWYTVTPCAISLSGSTNFSYPQHPNEPTSTFTPRHPTVASANESPPIARRGLLPSRGASTLAPTVPELCLSNLALGPPSVELRQTIFDLTLKSPDRRNIVGYNSPRPEERSLDCKFAHMPR